MAWNVSARGTKAACIAAVNAIAAVSDGNGNNQLARAKSAMITEINAINAGLASVVGFGNFDGGTSSMHFTVQSIPGVVSQEIASTPDDR